MPPSSRRSRRPGTSHGCLRLLGLGSRLELGSWLELGLWFGMVGMVGMVGAGAGAGVGAGTGAGVSAPPMAALPIRLRSGASAKTGAATASEPAAAAACDVRARLGWCSEAGSVWDATCDSGEAGCNTDEQPQLRGSSGAQCHLRDERTARRRGAEVQGIGARERKDDNQTAQHRLGERARCDELLRTRSFSKLLEHWKRG